MEIARAINVGPNKSESFCTKTFAKETWTLRMLWVGGLWGGGGVVGEVYTGSRSSAILLRIKQYQNVTPAINY